MICLHFLFLLREFVVIMIGFKISACMCLYSAQEISFLSLLLVPVMFNVRTIIL